LFAQAVRVASGLWGGGVLALAMHAFVALGTSASLPGSVLAVGSFTVGAFHLSILPHPIRHSLNSWVQVVFSPHDKIKF
jgi:hypothetical protein